MLIKCPACNFIGTIDAEESPRFECEECETKLKVPGTPAPKRKKQKSRGGNDRLVRNIVGSAMLFVFGVLGALIWIAQSSPALITNNTGGQNLTSMPDMSQRSSNPGRAASTSPEKTDTEKPLPSPDKEYFDLRKASEVALMSATPFKDLTLSSQKETLFEIKDLKCRGKHASVDFYTFTILTQGTLKKDLGALSVVAEIDGTIYTGSLFTNRLKSTETQCLLEMSKGLSVFNNFKKMSVWLEDFRVDFAKKTRGKVYSNTLTFTWE